MRDFLTARRISRTDVEPDVADMQIFQNRAEPIIMGNDTVTPTFDTIISPSFSPTF